MKITLRCIRLASLTVALGAGTASAFNYTDQDLLLVFREDSANDVIYDLGSVTNFLGHPDGFQVTVPFDQSVALAAYQNDLSTALFSLLASTAGATPLAQKRVWVSSGVSSDTPLDPPASVLASMGSLASNVGRDATQQTAASPIQDWSVSSSANTSYTYIMTANGTTPQSVDTMAGYWPYDIAGSIPSSVRFFQVLGTSVKPKPAAIQVGTFTLGTDGTLVFVAGAGTVVQIQTPVISGIQVQGNSASITVTASQTGVNYRLRYTAGLASNQTASWTAGLTVAGTGADLVLQDTSSDNARFYVVEAFQ
jgi:hypothetical protein